MALLRRVVRRVVIGLGGVGAASLAAMAVMKIYEQQAYAAYESLSGKKLKRNKLGLFKSQGNGDEVDAFKHTYVSAMMAQNFGRCIAYAGGEINEIKGDIFQNQEKEHRNMDERNSAEGRKIGFNVATKGDIKNAVWKALNDGVHTVKADGTQAADGFDAQSDLGNGNTQTASATFTRSDGALRQTNNATGCVAHRLGRHFHAANYSRPGHGQWFYLLP